MSVRVGATELQVSRRHARALRDRLMRRPGSDAFPPRRRAAYTPGPACGPDDRPSGPDGEGGEAPCGMAGGPPPCVHIPAASAAPTGVSLVSPEPLPRRETVTGEPRRVRPLPRYLAQSEIDEQTALGDAYVHSLMRGQLRAGLGAFALVAVLAGTLPLAFTALRSDWPSGSSWASAPIRCLWPRLVVRPPGRAQRTGLRPSRRRPRRAREPGYAVAAVAAVVLATVLVGGFGLRISRTTSRLLRGLAHRRARLNAAAISGEYLSAASFLGIAGLVLSTAPTCSGTRSATPPDIWSCWCSSPHPCAAPVPTPCPTSPRDGLSHGRSAAWRGLVVTGAGWLYLVPQLQGAGLTLEILTGAPGWLGPVIVARSS